MKNAARSIRLGLAFGCMAAAIASQILLPLVSAQEARTGAPVLVGEIRGTIDPATADFLETTIRRAQAQRAQAVVMELDTPGGLLTSVRSMAQAIDASTVPVIVYTTPAGASATSAGALLMMASHVAAMTPGTNIGAAHPVQAGGEEIEGAMGEKAVQDTAAFARSLAEVRGRNVKLAEEVVAKSKSMTSAEALERKLIDLVAESRTDLFAQLDGRKVTVSGKERVLRTKDAAVVQVEMSFGQKLMHLLAHPNVAAILMTLAMLLIYVEVSNPGLTIAGILGAICLLIAFMAFQILPIRTGGLAFLLLGMALMILEPFVASGGILAGGGIIAFVLGLIWVIDPTKSDLTVSRAVWLSSGIGLGFAAVVIGIAAARMRRLSRETLGRIGGGSLSGVHGYDAQVVEALEGGLKGKVRVRGEIWNFRSNEPVTAGEQVVVESVEGFVLRVSRKPASE